MALVLAKDMSRIGRDYLQIGSYAEIVFKQHGIRFIAIGSSATVIAPVPSEFAPFVNIMSELFRQSLSRLAAIR